MKKIIMVGTICLLSSLSLFGCGKNQDATLTNLANQIDLLNNTVSSISKSTEDIPPLSSLTKEQAINYSGIYQSARDITNMQTSFKTAILAKNSLIKNKIASRDLNLTNQNSKALSELTSSLSKDTKKLDETKAEFKSSVNDVKKVVSSSKTSTAQVSAKINRLSNCMDSQNCYYKNLLNTLNNIESILEIDDNSFDYNSLNQQKFDYPSRPTRKDNRPDLEELLYNFLIQQNINNLTKDTTNNTNQDENDCKDCDKQKNANTYTNISTPFPYNSYNYGYNNLNNGYYPYTYNLPYTSYGQYGFYGQIPYNNYGYAINRINPSRNTDSFRPWIVNIDTYKFPANQKNNLNSPVNITPIQSNPTLLEESDKDNIDNKTDDNKNIATLEQEKTEEAQDTEITTAKLKNKKQTKNAVKLESKQNENKDSDFAGLTKRALKSKNLDINKDIENLIKKETEKAFNEIENYIMITSF